MKLNEKGFQNIEEWLKSQQLKQAQKEDDEDNLELSKEELSEEEE